MSAWDGAPDFILALPGPIRQYFLDACEGDWRRVTADEAGSITVHNKPQFRRIELPTVMPKSRRQAPRKRTTRASTLPAAPVPVEQEQERPTPALVAAAGYRPAPFAGVNIVPAERERVARDILPPIEWDPANPSFDVDALLWPDHGFDASRERLADVLAHPERWESAVTHTGRAALLLTRGDLQVLLGISTNPPRVLSAGSRLSTSPTRHGTRSGGGSGTTYPTSLTDLEARVRELGLEFQGRGVTGGKHGKIIDPGTKTVVSSVPNTPSDHRALKNTWADVQRYLRGKEERPPPDADGYIVMEGDGTLWDPEQFAAAAQTIVDRCHAGIPAACPVRVHENVLSLSGINIEMVEAAVRAPDYIIIAPESALKKYPVLRFRKGDILTVVGFREPSLPTIIATYVDPLLEHDDGAFKGSKTAGGGARKGKGLPRRPVVAMKALRSRGADIEEDPIKGTAEVFFNGQSLGKISIGDSVSPDTVESDYQRTLRKIEAISARK